jgi:hypothetical protein
LAFWRASASSITFVAPEMSGSFSPASRRARVLLPRPASQWRDPRPLRLGRVEDHDAAFVGDDHVAGRTATPPQETGAQNVLRDRCAWS